METLHEVNTCNFKQNYLKLEMFEAVRPTLKCCQNNF